MDYLIEIGTEELPAGNTGEIAKNFKDLFVNKLAEKNLADFECKLYSTPRRIALILKNLPQQSQACQQIIKGPGLSAPQHAIEGFARKNNRQISELQQIDGRYCLVLEIAPIDAKKILKEALDFAISSLKGERWMSWGLGDFNFSRPVRWVVSILDNEVFDLEILGLKASNQTRINRFLEADQANFCKYVLIDEVSNYLKTLQNNFVEPNAIERQIKILNQIASLEKKHNFKVQVSDELLKEIVDLLEWPTALIGSFEENFLNLPDFLTITVLTHHQRYFPCFDAEGKLLNKFVFIANCLPEAKQTVIEGNERVLKARLKDAEFFVQEDLKTPLAKREAKLAQMTFQKELDNDPTMKGKAERIKFIVQKLAPSNFDLHKAAELAKCDLGSAIVFEFPELQGLTGGFIAQKQGQNKAVFEAIAEQYKPLAFGKELPQTQTSALLAIADKTDNLISLLSIDKMPTGSADPFALRRQTQGIIELLLAFLDLNLNLKQIAQIAYESLKSKNNFEEFFDNIAVFLKQRLIYVLSQSLNPDLVLAFTSSDLVLEMPLKRLKETIQNFEKAARQNKNSLLNSLIAIRRINRILKSKNFQALKGLNKNALELAEEKSLAEQKTSFDSWEELYNLVEPINNFFDKVLVDDPQNPKDSVNRQVLIGNILSGANIAFLQPDWDKLVNYLENTN